MQSELCFSCTVQRKNSKCQRILELYPNSLMICKNDTQAKCSTIKNNKKVLYLNHLDTQFEWIYNNKQLLGFTVFYYSQKERKKKQITYEAVAEALEKLKSIMNGKSLYVKMENQYQFIQNIENKQKKNVQIFQCLCIITNQIKVAKKIPIANSEPQPDLQEQVKILISINKKPHKCILKVDELFLDDNYLICIMNYCEGGTLFQYLCDQKDPLDFQIAIKITKKILKGVQHLHSMGIVHRDLKLDNIMLEEENNIKSLKIIDFEFSTFNISRNSLRCGTLGYMAPEILNGEEYGQKCDIYSLGCIFHAVLTGNKLYPTSTCQQNLLRLNKQNKFIISSKVFLSKAHETLLQMLSSEAQRPSAAELLDNELFQDKFKRNEKITHFIKKLEFPQLKNPFQSTI